MAQPFGVDRVFPHMMEDRAESTTLWALAFLAIAGVMSFVGLAWIAFGPPIR